MTKKNNKTAKRLTQVDHIAEGLRNLAAPLSTLHSDPDNVRTHPQRNIEAIKASLERFGQQAPVVYVRRGRKNVVIKGNGVLVAARSLGWTKIAAVPSSMAECDAAAFGIADNRTAELAAWDEPGLARLLTDLQAQDYTLLVATGFNDKELAEYLRDFDTDIEDGKGDAEQATETIRCPKCGHEFRLE